MKTVWLHHCRHPSLPIVHVVIFVLFLSCATSSNASPFTSYQLEQLSSHGVDDVGPAIANATQSALQQAQEILSNYTSILHGIAIPCGIAVAFFGYFLLSPVLFLAAFITGGGASFIAVSTILSDFTPSTAGSSISTPTGAWISIGAMLLGGALFGFLAMKALPLGMFAVGASLGVIFTSTLRSTVIPKLFPKNPQTAFIITAVALGLLLGILALIFQKQMLIFSTAYAGAVATIFGIGHFTGHFPTASQLEKLPIGDFNNGWVLLYLGIAFLLGTCGMFFQFWLAKDKPMPEYAPYDRQRRFPSRNRRRQHRYEEAYWDETDGSDDYGEWDNNDSRRHEQRRQRPYRQSRSSNGKRAISQGAQTEDDVRVDGVQQIVQPVYVVAQPQQQHVPVMNGAVNGHEGIPIAASNSAPAVMKSWPTSEKKLQSKQIEDQQQQEDELVMMGSLEDDDDNDNPSKETGRRNRGRERKKNTSEMIENGNSGDSELIDGFVQSSPASLFDVPLDDNIKDLSSIKV